MSNYERKLLAYLLQKPSTINNITILPEYFLDLQNQLLFKDIIKSYKNTGTVDFSKINNIILATEIMAEEMIYLDLWEKDLVVCENNIIENYKKIKKEQLLNSLKEGKIKEDKFIFELQNIHKINLTELVDSVLDIKDIKEDSTNRELVKSNIVDLDKAIGGFALGEMSVWSGGNGSAKSTFLNQLALESVNQGYKTLIYSGELKPGRLLKWLFYQATSKKRLFYYSIYDKYYVTDIDKDIIREWLDNKLFIYNNKAGSKAQTMINTLRNFIKTNDIKVVIIDNLMSLDLSEYGLTQQGIYMAQANIAKQLSAVAKELNVHIHFVCHPRKTMQFLRKNDISGSADLTNQADNVFILHRVNNDFKTRTKEMFGWEDDHPIYGFTNILEVCKCREFGTEDYFIGMIFENSNKKLLNYENEIRKYNWELNAEKNEK